MAESGFAVKENATHNQAKLDLLLSQSARSAKDNRWDLAYTYANEANLLSLEVVGGSDPLAKRYIQRALYKLMPEKRVLDRVEAVLNAARELLAKDDYQAGVRLSFAAYRLQRIKTPTPLILLADAAMNLRKHDFAYVFANEAQLLLLENGLLVDAAVRESRNCIAGYVNRTIEHNVAREDSVESAFVAPAYHHSAYPNREALDSLFVCWCGKGLRPTITCILEKVNGSVVKPAVRFADLPIFLAQHAAAGHSLRKIQLMFLLLPVGWPLETHFRTLLEARANQPSLFHMVKDVVVTSGDFHNITAATFNHLLTRVLASRNYSFTDLKRLPIGVKPADFLLHPSLVASHAIEFDLLSTIYSAEARCFPAAPRDEQLMSICAKKVVEFPTSAIVTHIKARSGYGYEEGADGSKVENNSNMRCLMIHSAYLTDGVTALVEALKQDFFDESHSPPSTFPFKLNVTYSDVGEFDPQLCGKWSTSFGEALHVGYAEYRSNPSLDNYTIAVARLRVVEGQTIEYKG